MLQLYYTRGESSIKTLIKNGYIVNFDGKFHGDILIEDGKIINIGKNIDDNYDKCIDAEGNYVFPGFIDAHTHLGRHDELGYSKETSDFYTETKAAYIGGTTTIFDFAYTKKGESLIAAVENKEKFYKGTDNCKYELHVVITEVREDIYHQLKELKRAGIKGVKVYTTHNIKLSNEEILKVMHYCAKLGMVILVHCEDDALIQYCKNKHNYNLRRPKKSEVNAVFTIINYALMTKCKTYFCNISCRKSLELISKAKLKGAKLYLETCPHYMLLNSGQYLRNSLKERTKFLVNPPLRDEKDNKALINGALGGAVDLISSDHYAYVYEEHKSKYFHDDDNAAKGIPGIQLRPSLIYTLLVEEYKLPVEEYVRLLSYSPSRIFNLFDRGYIRIGASADLVIWNKEKFKVSLDDLIEGTDYSPYEGVELTGRAKYVFK